MDTIFISYSFSDPNAAALCRIVREVATKLRRVTIVDGKTLDLRSDFSGTIATFIREQTDCVVAIFTQDEKAKPNVIYEVGIGVGGAKDVVLVAETLNDIPSMLKAYDVVTLDRNDLDWQDGFRVRLEQKLRRILQAPEDHLVEDKLARRYQPEEMERLRQPAKVQAAITSIRAGDLLKAEAILNHLLNGDSENLDALFLLAECSYLNGCSTNNPSHRTGFFVEQFNITVRALGYDPHHILSLHSKGQAELRLGRFSEAEATFQHLLDLDPEFSLTRYNLACLFALIDNPVDAVDQLNRAIIGNPIWKDFAKGDPDFAPLWDNQQWIDLVYS
jgi:tetratricopeptide (TPR) repeat protein